MEGSLRVVFWVAVALKLLLVLAVARIYGEVVKIRKLLSKSLKDEE